MTGSKSHKGQKYKNTYAFHHNKSSKKTKLILSFPINGLCIKCTQLIEWRKRYRKYKPLTVPRRCVKCLEKQVKEAYHECCHSCASSLQICAKCLQAWKAEEQETKEDRQEMEDFCRNLNAQLMSELNETEDCESEETCGCGEEIEASDEEASDSI
jgi:transcriptional regulator of met regulon